MTRADNVKRIAVLGAGTMGHGIAQVCAEAGYLVYLRDVEEELLRRARDRITRNIRELKKEGFAQGEKEKTILSNIVTTTDMKQAVSNVDIVFEAVPERMDLKKEVLRQANQLCPKHTIMASNTSSLSITQLATATSRPEKFIGAHWMLPPHTRPLVEIIRGAATSDNTFGLVRDLFEKKLRKIIIVCKDSPGFIVNRMQASMLREAIALVDEGLCDMADVDLAWTQHLGQRYCVEGPFEFLDRAGLDTWHSVFQSLYEGLKESKFQPPDSISRKLKAGELGLKTGKGFYDYSGKSVDDVINQRDGKILHLLKLYASN